MNKPLMDQRALSENIAREILGDIKLNVTDAEFSVSFAHQEALESYVDLLERQEQELIDELQRTVLHLSAKIAATRNLRSMAIREAGKQEGFRAAEDIKERGESA